MNKLQRLIQRARAKGVDDVNIKALVHAYRTGAPQARAWKRGAK